MESNDVDEEICFCGECWDVGDEQAFLKVEALKLPIQIDLTKKNYFGLGERITEQAEDLLDFLEDKFGENLPFLMGLALRMSYYAEYRANGKIESNVLADRYSPHIEDKVSKKFRIGTPISEPVGEKDLLDFLGVFMLSIAADFQSEGDTQHAFDAIFQANFLIALSATHDCVESQIEAMADGKRDSLSAAGRKGAIAKNLGHQELKRWALKKGEKLGASKDVARRLAAQLPKHLADVSKEPERLIYDALRGSAKPS